MSHPSYAFNLMNWKVSGQKSYSGGSFSCKETIAH